MLTKHCLGLIPFQQRGIGSKYAEHESVKQNLLSNNVDTADLSL
jgi:hypothetical protein